MINEKSREGTDSTLAKSLTRSGIEEILKTQYGVRLAGFWRWLYEQGEIDAKEPSEEINPHMIYTKHKSTAHSNSFIESSKLMEPLPNCKVCGLLSALCKCWNTAFLFNHPFRAVLPDLNDLQAHIEEVHRICFGRDGALPKAIESLDPHLRQGAIKKEKEISITTFPGAQALILSLNKVRGSAKEHHKDIDVFFSIISDLMGILVAPELYIEDQEILLTSLCFNLHKSGFRDMEIADILKGAKPYTRRKGLRGMVLTLECKKAQDSVKQRRARYRNLIKNNNLDP